MAVRLQAADSNQAAMTATSAAESSMPIEHVAIDIKPGSAIRRRCIAKGHAQAAESDCGEACLLTASSFATSAAQPVVTCKCPEDFRRWLARRE